MRVGRHRTWLALVTAAALVVALVPLLPAAAAPIAMQPVSTPDTFYVNGGVAGPGSGTQADPFRLLTHALAAAYSGDTVIVAGGMYGEQEGETLPFVVRSGVTVIGTPPPVAPGSATSAHTNLYGSLDATNPIMVVQDAGGVVLRNVAFSDNFNSSPPTSTALGGGLYVENSEVSLQQCMFVRLSAFAGGGIFSSASDLTIEDCVFEFCGFPIVSDAEGLPEGVESRLEQLGIADLSLDPAPVDAQQPMGTCLYGGGVFAINGVTNLAECLFLYNGAEISGGAVLNGNGTCRSTDTVYLFNGALYGAGQVESAEDAADVWAQVDPDTGPIGGGAVANYLGGFEENGSYYVGNVSDPGSALVSISGGAVVRRAVVQDGEGAAIVEFDGVGTADASGVFSRMQAATPAELGIPMGLDIDATVFENNEGVVTTFFGSGFGRVTNSLYLLNSAVDTVAFIPAIESNEADSVAPIGFVEGCTFTENYAEHTIVRGAAFSGTILANSILWGNSGPGEYAATDVMAWNTDSGSALSGLIDPSCFSLDPRFRDPGTGDFRLAIDSPCVDGGAEAAPLGSGLVWAPRAWDLDLLSRPVDGDGDGDEEFDIGAYELLPSDRLGGADRYETAIEISSQYFEHADTVVIATGRTFADGLAGSGLAGSYGAPLLLSDATWLSPSVRDEILRLGATRAFVLGGENAIKPAVFDALGDLGLEVVRIGGQDRYETAALIAEHMLTRFGPFVVGTRDAIIARGDLFPDALAAAPVAYANMMPVLLVDPTQLPEHSIDVLHNFGITSVVIVGGEAAVSAAVADEISAAVPDIERISGADRYETAANFAEWAWEGGYASFGVTGVATGEDFADALSGGAGIGSQNGLLLLNPHDVVNSDCADKISLHADEIVTLQAFGGINALAEDVYQALLDLLP